MYNITLQRDCMNIKLDEDTQINNYGKGVLLHNQIKGILSASFSVENGMRVFKYDTTGCGKIREAFGAYIEKSKMLGILRDICNTIRELENYGISQEMVVLDKSMVWYNIAQQKAELVLLPIKERQTENFGDFLRMLIISMPIGSGVQSQYTLDILAYINRMPDITPEQMYLYLNPPKESKKECRPVELKKEQEVHQKPAVNRAVEEQPSVMEEKSEKPAKNGKGFSSILSRQKPELVQSTPAADSQVEDDLDFTNLFSDDGGKKNKKEKKEKEKGGGLFSFMNKPKEDKKKKENEFESYQQEISLSHSRSSSSVGSTGCSKQGSGMSMFRDEGVLGTRAGEREYGFTGATSESGVYLIQVSNQRKYNIRSSGATIGTLSENQIVVQNTKVSRHHARVFYDGGSLLLMIDERSKNPSYLNGTLIGKGMSAPLQDGDRFRLADEEFEVRMS